MNKTIFEITKMDCPSEENLIRMKLDEVYRKALAIGIVKTVEQLDCRR